jgi:single-strand DNA-binding protein
MENVVNKVVLTGFAGSDVEVQTVGNNQKLAKVNLAVNEYYKDSNGTEVKKTHWFPLVFWNINADVAEKEIKKGIRLTIQGKLQTRSYESKDGIKRYSTDVVVNELEVKMPA